MNAWLCKLSNSVYRLQRRSRVSSRSTRGARVAHLILSSFFSQIYSHFQDREYSEQPEGESLPVATIT